MRVNDALANSGTLLDVAGAAAVGATTIVASGANVNGIYVKDAWVCVAATGALDADFRLRFGASAFPILAALARQPSLNNVIYTLRQPIFIPNGQIFEYINANATPYKALCWYQVL